MSMADRTRAMTGSAFRQAAVLGATAAMLLLLPAGAVQAAQWVAAQPATSCAAVCSSAGSSAITPGNDKQGYQFYVCAGKAQNGESRPGFNIDTSPDSSKKCLFEYGGKRGESSSYSCLCN